MQKPLVAEMGEGGLWWGHSDLGQQWVEGRLCISWRLTQGSGAQGQVQGGLRQCLSRILGLGLSFPLRGPHSARKFRLLRAELEQIRGPGLVLQKGPQPGAGWGAFYAPIPLCCSSFCC